MKRAHVGHGTADARTRGMHMADEAMTCSTTSSSAAADAASSPSCRPQGRPAGRPGPRCRMRHRRLHPRGGRSGHLSRDCPGSGPLPRGHRSRPPSHPPRRLHLFGVDRRSPRRAGRLVRRRGEQPDDPSPTRKAGPPGDPEIFRVLRPGGRVLIAGFRPPTSRIGRHLIGRVASPPCGTTLSICSNR